MFPTDILTSSWDAYDQRKAQHKQDESIFCPDDPWEFNFLVEKIVSVEPHLDELTVMLAVRQSMRQTIAPRPRMHFVTTVVNSIHDREAQWAQVIEEAEVNARRQETN